MRLSGAVRTSTTPAAITSTDRLMAEVAAEPLTANPGTEGSASGVRPAVTFPVGPATASANVSAAPIECARLAVYCCVSPLTTIVALRFPAEAVALPPFFFFIELHCPRPARPVPLGAPRCSQLRRRPRRRSHSPGVARPPPRPAVPAVCILQPNVPQVQAVEADGTQARIFCVGQLSLSRKCWFPSHKILCPTDK